MKRNAIKGVEYRTIHSMLALKQETDFATGKISFKPDKLTKDDPPIAHVKVLIVDETSMLNDELFTYLVPWIKQGLKVIFTGDGFQIPQVHNEKRDGKPFVKPCIPFRNAVEWKALSLELSQPMRQANGNPILEFATHLRQHPAAVKHTPNQHLTDEGLGIKLIQHDSPEEHALLEEYFGSPKFKEDADHFKVIAWRNATVASYNQLARSIIYKDIPNLPALMIGEKIIMEKPYVVTNRQIVSVNEELEITECTQHVRDFSYRNAYGQNFSKSILCYYVTAKYFTDDQELTARFYVPHESAKADYNKMLEDIKGFALEAPFNLKGNMWRHFYEMESKLAWVDYNYAITAHCSRTLAATYLIAGISLETINLQRKNEINLSVIWLKIDCIGQSAAKPRIEERSETISRKESTSVA